jgi:hypothetical protein
MKPSLQFSNGVWYQTFNKYATYVTEIDLLSIKEHESIPNKPLEIGTSLFVCRKNVNTPIDCV